MGILDKIMFWKHEEEFPDLGNPPVDNDPFSKGTDLGLDNKPQEFPETPDFSRDRMPSHFEPVQSNPEPQSAFQPQIQSQNNLISKDIEIISSKLDALKASLESINQRLVNIENIARNEQSRSQTPRW